MTFYLSFLFLALISVNIALTLSFNYVSFVFALIMQCVMEGWVDWVGFILLAIS